MSFIRLWTPNVLNQTGLNPVQARAWGGWRGKAPTTRRASPHAALPLGPGRRGVFSPSLLWDQRPRLPNNRTDDLPYFPHGGQWETVLSAERHMSYCTQKGSRECHPVMDFSLLPSSLLCLQLPHLLSLAATGCRGRKNMPASFCVGHRMKGQSDYTTISSHSHRRGERKGVGSFYQIKQFIYLF